MSYKYEDYKTYVEDNMNTLNDLNDGIEGLHQATNQLYQLQAGTQNAIQQMLSITQRRDQLESFQHEVKNQVYKIHSVVEEGGFDSALDTHMLLANYRRWISESNITVDVFDKIEEKDYFKNTHKVIVGFHSKLLENCSPEMINYFDNHFDDHMFSLNVNAQSFSLFATYFKKINEIGNDSYFYFDKVVDKYWGDIRQKGNVFYNTENINELVDEYVKDLKREFSSRKHQAAMSMDRNEDQRRDEFAGKVHTGLMVIYGILCLIGMGGFVSDIANSKSGFGFWNIVGIIFTLGVMGAVGYAMMYVSLAVAAGLSWVMKLFGFHSKNSEKKELEEKNKQLDGELEEFLSHFEDLKKLDNAYIKASFEARDESEALLNKLELPLFDFARKEEYQWTSIFTFYNEFKNEVLPKMEISLEDVKNGNVDIEKEVGKLLAEKVLTKEKVVNEFVKVIEQNHKEVKTLSAA